MKEKSFASKIWNLFRNNSVPFMFIIICAVCIPISGFSLNYLLAMIGIRRLRIRKLFLAILVMISARR